VAETVVAVELGRVRLRLRVRVRLRLRANPNLTLTLALTLTLTLTWLLAARKGVASRSDCSMISRGSTCEISRRCGGDVGRYRGRYGGDVEEM